MLAVPLEVSIPDVAVLVAGVTLAEPAEVVPEPEDEAGGRPPPVQATVVETARHKTRTQPDVATIPGLT